MCDYDQMRFFLLRDVMARNCLTRKANYLQGGRGIKKNGSVEGDQVGEHHPPPPPRAHDTLPLLEFLPYTHQIVANEKR